ncbi:MAG: T9SS type A sorting domain-containing protein [Chlorobi bacterium]|nr:T9SS type A sorting domain-containing protein [Chlorobiota bacterium]
MKKHKITIVFLFVFFIGFSQNTILCPQIENPLKIENVNDVPIVTNNNDGTITLTHSQQYITDIFSNYIIYDFYQTFPNGSENLQKYYTISFNDKDLINELKTSVPPEVFLIESNYINTLLSTEIISFLDGKKFNLSKYQVTNDGCVNNCLEQDVPNNFTLKVEFNYDSINDLLFMESIGLTPCGNSFYIALKGGSVDNTLQLWESTANTISSHSFSDPCYNIENELYSMFDISCNNYNIGDLIPTINIENNTLFLWRSNQIFGFHSATFKEDTLSLEELILEDLRLYEIDGNPYLQISNSNNSLYIEIYSITGKVILKKTLFEDNKILINQLSNNLYFIKVNNSQNQFKVFKFIKR